MSLGSRVRRNFTLRLLCPFWVNVRTANQFNDITTGAPPGKRPDIGANGSALRANHPRHTKKTGRLLADPPHRCRYAAPGRLLAQVQQHYKRRLVHPLRSVVHSRGPRRPRGVGEWQAGVLGRRRVLDRERKTMNTNWIRAALADRGLQAKDLAKRWGVTDAVASRFINEGDPELTWDRAVLLARLLDLDLNQLHAKLGSVSGKSEFTWFHAEFVAQRLGMDMKQLHEKIGGGPINW
jgi:hypothetical protein